MFQETGFTKSKPVIPLKTCYSKTEKKLPIYPLDVKIGSHLIREYILPSRYIILLRQVLQYKFASVPQFVCEGLVGGQTLSGQIKVLKVRGKNHIIIFNKAINFLIVEKKKELNFLTRYKKPGQLFLKLL